MAKLESLIVDMQLQFAELHKGLEQVKGELKETAKHAEGLLNFEVLKEVGHFALEAAEKLGEFVLESAEAADRMGKMASASQVGVEEFQRLAYATKLGGVSAEDLGGAFNKLNKALGEATGGSKEKVALFKALDVSLKDASGTARSSSDIFRELATKLNEMAPGYAKATLEQDLFGKSGAQLDQALKGVAEGLADAGGEADRFGVVLSASAIESITEFNDNLQRMKLAVEGVGQRTAAELAPAMEELTKQLLTSKSGMEGLKDAADVLATALRLILSLVIPIVGSFNAMGITIGGTAAAMWAFATRDFQGASDIVADTADKLKENARDTADHLSAVWKTAGEASKEGAAEHKKNAASVLENMKRLSDAAKEMEERFRAAKALAEKLFGEHAAETDTGRKNSQVTEQSIERAQAFADIGRTVDQVNARLIAATKGFSGFDDALEQFTTAQIGINNEQEAMAEAKKNLDAEGYDFASEALANQEEIANRARKALEAFGKLKEIAKASVDTFQGAMKALGGALLQAVPRLNELVQAAQQGAAAGGVWGALIAVFVQLLSKTEGFKRILAIFDHDLDGLIEAINPIATCIADLMGAMGSLSDGITGMIAPIFKVIGDLLSRLAPLLSSLTGNLAPAMGVMSLIGDLLSPIIELIGLIANLLKLFAEPLRFFTMIIGLVSTILKLLMLPLTLLGELFSELSKALGPVFDKIDVAFSWLSNRFAEFADWVSKLGERIKNFIEHQVFMTDAEREEALHPTPKTETQTSDGLISDVTRDTVGAVADLGTSASTTAAVLDKLSDQFTNVPQWFKRGLRTYQSADASVFSDAGGGSGQITRPNLTVTVHGNLIHENQFMDYIEKQQAKRAFQRGDKP